MDLKVTELTHQDIGQMDFYVRYFEDRVKQPDDNPTIGLILCTEKDRTVVKYSLLSESKQIFASKYQLYLPTEEALRKELEREKQEIEIEKGLQRSGTGKTHLQEKVGQLIPEEEKIEITDDNGSN